MRTASLCVLACLSIALSGCATGDEPDATASPPADAAPSGGPQTQTVEFPPFALSTYGNHQVAGTYINPGVASVHDPQDYNCVVFETKGSYVQRIDATAEWADGSRLVLYHQLKDPNEPWRDEGDAVGASPLTHAPDLSGDKPSESVWVGVGPAPDMPVSTGLTDGITLHVAFDYTGPVAPTVRGLGYCSHNPPDPPAMRPQERSNTTPLSERLVQVTAHGLR